MGTNLQSIDVHLADSSNNTEGRNNFNNNSLSHYDSTLKLPNEDDKGEDKEQTQPQRQEQASHKTQPAGMEMQQRTNDQKNAANGKESQQIHKQSSTQAQRQENSQQGENNSANHSNRTIVNFQSNFPKISNNFTRYDPNSQIDRNKQMNNDVQGNARPPNIQQQGQNISNNVKQGKISEPAPYTVVQSFAARLRYNQSKNEIPIVLNDPIHTTRQGYPAVLLDENDYYVKLAECNKYTFVGKFTNTMPKMELV
ncbi:hypothetical protein EJD97_011818, partial [Solanum chilense]